MSEANVLELHERVGPSIYEEHHNFDRLDVHGFKPEYGTYPLQSLSTVFRRARYLDHRASERRLLLIDAWHGEKVSRFITDNFGTYHGSYGTTIYPTDARPAAQLLTVVSSGKKADDRLGISHELITIPSELEAFKEFANRRASSLSVASMDFAKKLDIYNGKWSKSFHLVVGGTFKDRILFWNGRLLIPNWVGSDIGAFRVDEDQLADDEFFAALVTLINQRNFVNSGSGGPYRITVRSSSMTEDSLSAIRERLRSERCWSISDTQCVPDLSAMAPSAKSLARASPSSPLGSTLSSRTGEEFRWTSPQATLATSLPDHVFDVPYGQVFGKGVWASDILLDHGEEKPRFSNGNTWLLPRRWRMAGAFKVDFTATSRNVTYPARSSRFGELTLFESMERRVRAITVPTGGEAIRHSLLEDGRWANMTNHEGAIAPKSPLCWMEASNEARYLNGVLGMIGNLDQASRFLLHPFMRKVLEDLGGMPGIPLEAAQESIAKLRRAGKNISPFDLKNENDRLELGALVVQAAKRMKSPLRYLRYSSISDRWKDYREAFWDRIGRENRVDKTIDWDAHEQASLDQCLISMRQRQILFQGHEWTCPECHHRNWVDMANLRPVLACDICRHVIDAPIAFDWLFRASNFLVEALRDHGTLALIWTLDAVRNQTRNAFIYAGPTCFWFEHRDQGPDAEADLLIVSDQSTIVAEVKSSWAGVRTADIIALGDTAKRLRPDIALLAVMDNAQRHTSALQDLKAELEVLGVRLQVMTLDTNPFEDAPYLH